MLRSPGLAWLFSPSTLTLYSIQNPAESHTLKLYNTSVEIPPRTHSQTGGLHPKLVACAVLNVSLMETPLPNMPRHAMESDARKSTKLAHLKSMCPRRRPCPTADQPSTTRSNRVRATHGFDRECPVGEHAVHAHEVAEHEQRRERVGELHDAHSGDEPRDRLHLGDRGADDERERPVQEHHTYRTKFSERLNEAREYENSGREGGTHRSRSACPYATRGAGP